MKMTLYILSFLLSLSFFAQNDVVFDKANTLYNEGKYADAISQYESILATRNHSAALYFNLGNAHYKLNNIGPSIYYYEKALLLAPNDADIKNNLAFAENAKVDAIESLPKTIFYKWYHTISDVLTFDGWAYSTVLFSICFMLFFLIYYFSYSERIKRLFFAAATFSIVFIGMSLSMAYSIYDDAIKNQPAIIFAESIEVREAPNLGSEISFTLHEGTKVQILDTVNQWKEIKLTDGKIGWIENEDIKEL